MNKLYIFDMGNVLCENSNVIPAIVNYLSITENLFFQHAGENFRRLLEGKISSHKFWDDFALKSGQVIKGELFGKFFHPQINEEVKKIILRLKTHSRVVCGTNVIDSHYVFLQKKNIYNIFHKVYSSHLMGVAKPDPNFYLYILKEENILPEDVIFVDDMLENIVSAQNLGIRSILFENLSKLKFNLRI